MEAGSTWSPLAVFRGFRGKRKTSENRTEPSALWVTNSVSFEVEGQRNGTNRADGSDVDPKHQIAELLQQGGIAESIWKNCEAVPKNALRRHTLQNRLVPRLSDLQVEMESDLGETSHFRDGYCSNGIELAEFEVKRAGGCSPLRFLHTPKPGYLLGANPWEYQTVPWQIIELQRKP
ncbi:hypothetical protein CYMTET_37984 [Cymbomonas tetramitiformis]|uniref:Uncharacterized protein n=1 Tax=Cymbomonas tetramitiformis TaxID=36881 RepID=A0AAE0CCV5_9CHLO|nr:hypothetical protein CYMTET_37984 [Cymbomonas tetramitiformis]